MKIAYLITAYGQYDHLRRLVAALDEPSAHFFIHIDARSPSPGDLGDGLVGGGPDVDGSGATGTSGTSGAAGGSGGSGRVTLIPRRRVWWGGWSHTAVILDLMRAALGPTAPTDFDYVAIVSGGDYPLRPTAELHRILATGGEFINLREGFRPDKPEKRLKYYFFDGFDRRRLTPKALLMRTVELALRPVALVLKSKRRRPFERVYVGTVWSVLSAGCVRYILDYVDGHPEYVRLFRTALVPEESFFHTIIGNSPWGERVRTSLTYTDWSAPGATGPATITMEHLDRLAPGRVEGWGPRDYEPFFARKFSDASAAVVEAIDKRFRL